MLWIGLSIRSESRIVYIYRSYQYYNMIPLKLKLNMNQNMKINDTMICNANLHSVYRLAWEEYEPKIWPDHWV